MIKMFLVFSILTKEEMGMTKDNKNIVSIEDRIPRLKEARKKKANRRLVFYMTIFFFLISIIVYLQSPLSDVKTVEINNNSFISDEEILELSGLDGKVNIWSIETDQIKDELEKNPVIDEVTVERILPQTVRISVQEKKIIGFVEEDSLFYPVLENGELLMNQSSNSFTGEAPLLIGFHDKTYLENLSSELGKLPEDILGLISEIFWKPEEGNNNNILLYMNEGFIVKGSIRGLAEGMNVYPSVVAQLDPNVKGIIHMGVGVYFEAFDKENEEDSIEDEGEETVE